MEPIISLPYSQELANASSPQPPTLFPLDPFLYYLPPTSRSSKLSLPFAYSNQSILRALLISPILSTCLAHLILLDLFILIIFGVAYKLCSLLQPLATSSLLFPNILLSTLFSNTLNLCSYLSVIDQFSHPYKK
jgi:hypothetical protein